MKYRKKPVVIEAMQVPAINAYADDFLVWAEEVGFDDDYHPPRPLREADRGCYFIRTLEGVMRADPGDFIIKGVNGEFYPCKPDIFALTYESVDD
jgi:hypothetical protein